MTRSEQPRDVSGRFGDASRSVPEVELTAVDEYAIDATRFRTVLEEQKRAKLKGGLYHINQIEMAYNSNRIEGSSLTAEQTRYLFETRTIMGDAPLNDAVEMDNSFRGFDAMIEHVGKPITTASIRDYHRILKEGTADSRHDWFVVGDWKTVANEVGGRETTPPEDVDQEMSRLVRRFDGRRLNFHDVTEFHVRFEQIHPFQDGNGRVGRLIMFEQCLANGITPFIVLDNKKPFYYRGLAEYDEEPGLLRDTFRDAQDTYYARFSKFIPRVN